MRSFCPVCGREAKPCYILREWKKVVPKELQEYVIHFNCLTSIVKPAKLAKLRPTGYRKKQIVDKMKKLKEEGKITELQKIIKSTNPDYFESFDPDKEFVGKPGQSVALIKQEGKYIYCNYVNQIGDQYEFVRTRVHLDDGNNLVYESNTELPAQKLGTKAAKLAFDRIVQIHVQNGFNPVYAYGQVDTIIDKFFENA